VEDEEEKTIGEIIRDIDECMKLENPYEKSICFSENFWKLKNRIKHFDEFLDREFKLFYRAKGYKSRAEIGNIEENPEFWAEWDEYLSRIFEEEFKREKLNEVV